MAKNLRRSKTDRQLSGVCGGIAEYLGLEPRVVRAIAFVLLVFTSAPVVMMYLGAVLFIPEGDVGEPKLEVDWRADGTRLAWRGATVPYAWSWQTWLGLGLFGVLLVVATLFGAGALAPLPVDRPAFVLVLATFSTLSWPLFMLYLAVPWLPRPYALTLTHAALWVERPLRAAERVDPASIESVHRDSSGLHLLLDSGETLRLPPAPADVALDEFLDELQATRQSALGHHQDLESGAEERARLEHLVAAERA